MRLKRKFIHNPDNHFVYTQTEGNLILRDYLALERTKLANERTFLIYIKFALYLLIAAITIFKIEAFSSLITIAYIFIVSSLIVLYVGIYRYRQLHKSLNDVHLPHRKIENK